MTRHDTYEKGGVLLDVPELRYGCPRRHDAALGREQGAPRDQHWAGGGVCVSGGGEGEGVSVDSVTQ